MSTTKNIYRPDQSYLPIYMQCMLAEKFNQKIKKIEKENSFAAV